MKRLCVTSCGSAKIWGKNPSLGPTEAKDVYIGDYTRALQTYAQHFFNDDWVILSAKYGFLRPTDIVPEDYNVTFNHHNSEVISVEELINQVKEKQLDAYDEIVVVAGKKYAKIVQKAFGNNRRYSFPLQGCNGMIYMKQRAEQAVSSNEEIS